MSSVVLKNDSHGVEIKDTLTGNSKFIPWSSNSYNDYKDLSVGSVIGEAIKTPVEALKKILAEEEKRAGVIQTYPSTQQTVVTMPQTQTQPSYQYMPSLEQQPTYLSQQWNPASVNSFSDLGLSSGGLDKAVGLIASVLFIKTILSLIPRR